MTAKEAKIYGATKGWERYLFWKGKKLHRFSKEYLHLIESAYRSLLSNPKFKQTLVDLKRNLLLHIIGKTSRRHTVLTWWEFVGILNKMRKEMRKNG